MTSRRPDRAHFNVLMSTHVHNHAAHSAFYYHNSLAIETTYWDGCKENIRYPPVTVGPLNTQYSELLYCIVPGQCQHTLHGSKGLSRGDAVKHLQALFPLARIGEEVSPTEVLTYPWPVWAQGNLTDHTAPLDSGLYLVLSLVGELLTPLDRLALSATCRKLRVFAPPRVTQFVGNTRMVNWLFQRGWEPSFADLALKVAAAGDITTLWWILRQAKSGRGQFHYFHPTSVLNEGAERGHLPIMKLMLWWGAMPNYGSVRACVQSGQVECLSWLLDTERSQPERGLAIFKNKLLHQAISLGHEELVTYLFTLGAQAEFRGFGEALKFAPPSMYEFLQRHPRFDKQTIEMLFRDSAFRGYAEHLPHLYRLGARNVAEALTGALRANHLQCVEVLRNL